MQFNQEQLDEQIKDLKRQQDISAYNSQLFDCKRRLLEIDKTKLGILARVEELELKIMELN